MVGRARKEGRRLGRKPSATLRSERRTAKNAARFGIGYGAADRADVGSNGKLQRTIEGRQGASDDAGNAPRNERRAGGTARRATVAAKIGETRVESIERTDQKQSS